MAETNAAALCEAGRRDAQALTVTGRRRARPGSRYQPSAAAAKNGINFSEASVINSRPPSHCPDYNRERPRGQANFFSSHPLV